MQNHFQFQSLKSIDLKTLKFQAWTFRKRQILAPQSPDSWVQCLHHWNTTPVVINRAALAHEWSKSPEFFRFCQEWSWGEPWKFNVTESTLLSVRNPIFEAMIRNYPHIFNRILVLVVWFDVVFSLILWLIWGLTRFIRFFPTFSTVICQILMFTAMQELLTLFLERLFLQL